MCPPLYSLYIRVCNALHLELVCATWIIHVFIALQRVAVLKCVAVCCSALQCVVSMTSSSSHSGVRHDAFIHACDMAMTTSRHKCGENIRWRSWSLSFTFDYTPDTLTTLLTLWCYNSQENLSRSLFVLSLSLSLSLSLARSHFFLFSSLSLSLSLLSLSRAFLIRLLSLSLSLSFPTHTHILCRATWVTRTPCRATWVLCTALKTAELRPTGLACVCVCVWTSERGGGRERERERARERERMCFCLCMWETVGNACVWYHTGRHACTCVQRITHLWDMTLLLHDIPTKHPTALIDILQKRAVI